MKEVSGQGVAFFLTAAKTKGITIDRLTQGTDLTESELRAKDARLGWGEYVRFMKNVGEVWTDDELVEFGRVALRSPFRAMASVARLLFSATDFYEWVTRRQMGAGNQFFTCVEATLNRVHPLKLEIILALPDGYENCREFLLVTKGVFTEMPTILGLRPATVALDVQKQRGVYVIDVPPGGGWLPRLKRFFLYPLSARDVAQGLKDANESLQKRLEELSSAQAETAQRGRELELVSRIANAAHRNVRLDGTLKEICRQICTQLRYDYARVSVMRTPGDPSSVRVADEGRIPEGSNQLTVELAATERVVDQILVARKDPISQDEARFLRDVANACALAVSNAIAFEEIQKLHDEVEDKVVQRTAQLENALAQVRHQQETRQRIFQNISHELRTPLSLIGLATGDIEARDGEHISSKTKERLGQIDDAVTRLLNLFDGMLLLAAGQEGKLRVKATDCDLAITLRSLVSAWSVVGEKNGIRISFVGPDRLKCRLDEQGIERAVVNLLSNAVKFTPNGGTVEVRVGAIDNNRVEVSISDTGVGMDDEFLKRAFGRFEQGPAPVRPGERGSGIGLAIVKEIAEAHGGTATVKSQRGTGSTFTLTLPREQDVAKLSAQGEGSYIPAVQHPVVGDPTRPDSANEVTRAFNSREFTVLVAEDEPQLRTFLVELLSREYNVIAAPDGLAALALAEKHAPHLLLSDVGMPGINGLELTRRFREAAGFRLSPVILLTAYAVPEARLDGLEAGAVDYVTKPFHPGELLARIRGQLELRQMALRLHETQKLAGLGVLAAGLAHELRNPATGVVSAIEPLKKLLPAEAKSQAVSQLLEAITLGSKQLEVLTRQLIGFTKQGPLDVRPETLEGILDTAEGLARPTLDSRLLKRELGYVGSVRCSRGLVIQVLVNLLENAAHATAPESEITVRTHEQNRVLCVDVIDHGTGIKPALRDRLFDPFFTTKEPGQGTGLGLTVSRLIAERHGGALKLLDSEAGAAFRLELPLNDVELPQDSPRLLKMAGAPV
jgi:signal transduction histidine kinase